MENLLLGSSYGEQYSIAREECFASLSEQQGGEVGLQKRLQLLGAKFLEDGSQRL
jgi:hypothetical protein